MTKAIFITGNADKAKHVQMLLGKEIEHQSLDLDEIQSANPAEIVEHKARQAYAIVGSPVFVDDFSLGLDELGGLPGPFIKLFIGIPDGLERLCRMADGLASRRATARGYFGYCDENGVQIMHGELHGEIAQHPSDSTEHAFGADPIFVVDGYDGRTRAQLTSDEYADVYKIVRPIDELRKLLG